MLYIYISNNYKTNSKFWLNQFGIVTEHIIYKIQREAVLPELPWMLRYWLVPYCSWIFHEMDDDALLSFQKCKNKTGISYSLRLNSTVFNLRTSGMSQLAEFVTKAMYAPITYTLCLPLRDQRSLPNLYYDALPLVREIHMGSIDQIHYKLRFKPVLKNWRSPYILVSTTFWKSRTAKIVTNIQYITRHFN